MPIPRFNKNAECGHVFGLPGVAYEQNGHLYNYDGCPVTLEGELIVEAASAEQPAPAPAPAPKKGGAKKSANLDPPSIDEDTPADELNMALQAYVQDPTSYPFQTMRDTVSRLTGIQPQSKDDVLDLINRILAGEKFAPANT